MKNKCRHYFYNEQDYEGSCLLHNVICKGGKLEQEKCHIAKLENALVDIKYFAENGMHCSYCKYVLNCLTIKQPCSKALLEEIRKIAKGALELTKW